MENHSKECEELKKDFPINYLEIKEEIISYQKFANTLKIFLNNNPNTSFLDFKKYGKKLYLDIKLNFNLTQNYYPNLCYSLRKHSNIFKKYPIFDNQLTKESAQFLKDYCMTMLYNKTNNSQFEHVIFISDYFIKKLNTALHFYIDGTFIYSSRKSYK